MVNKWVCLKVNKLDMMHKTLEKQDHKTVYNN
jgi:hypothetical protein